MTTEAHVVRGIKEARAAIEAATQDLITEVWLARSHGAAWTVIGEALGISKQAAHKRFAHLDGLEAEQLHDHYAWADPYATLTA